MHALKDSNCWPVIIPVALSELVVFTGVALTNEDVTKTEKSSKNG
jgi:hypothetical protein